MMEEKYVTSAYYKDEGPFTLDELKARAKDKIFTPETYVLKDGDNKDDAKNWKQAKEITALKSCFEADTPAAKPAAKAPAKPAAKSAAKKPVSKKKR
jgi:hypothetical protein